MRKLITKEFIAKAKLVHGETYDYDKAEYKGNKGKVIIICKIHGEFEQIAGDHIKSSGCPSCVYCKRISTEEFIEKAKLVHGDKFDYSKVIYINNSEKVIIICHIHGEFLKSPSGHLSGEGCSKCNGKSKSFTEEFITKAKEIHGDKYEYSKVIYVNNSTKIIITCPFHGDFSQKPNGHLNGKKCSRCARISSIGDFILKTKIVHNNKYDYSKVDYINAKTKVIIICKIHGEFSQAPSIHLQGVGCPICCESKGEKETAKVLTEMGVKFEREKRYKDCRNVNTLPFDFFLPEFNTVIEFQGIQHRLPIERFGGLKTFIEVQKRDKIKANYCNEKNRPKLLIIEEIKDISEKIKNYLARL